MAQQTRTPAGRASEETPMMRQYHAAKKKYPHAVLFFRMGDFYELFFEDAKLASKLLGLTLTSRTKEKDVPMAGVPVKAMEAYLVRLVRAGHAVAICDQVKDPRECKGIVDREVVRVVSPGTLVDDETLEGAEPLFVLAVHPYRAPRAEPVVGLAWADISTGLFRCAEIGAEQFAEDLNRIGPAEVLWPDFAEEAADDPRDPVSVAANLRRIVEQEELPFSTRAAWTFDPHTGRRELCEQLKVGTLDAFGVAELPAALGACGALLDYLKDTQKSGLANLRDLKVHRASGHMVLDRTTRRTLEITHSLQDGTREGTLLAVLDRSETPMGARRIRDWVLEPLVDRERILKRQAAVAELVEDVGRRRSIRERLDGLGDLERLCGKVASGRAGARDLVGLANAMGRVPALQTLVAECHSGAMAALAEELDPRRELTERIGSTLVEDPPLSLREGGLLRDGFHAEVDELRELARGGKRYLAELQQRESERTGIPSLKIGFNKVFGYYLEITHAHRDAVPEEYIRKQTLKNAERYITPELKEYETKVLHAEDRLKDLEYDLFLALREAVASELDALLSTATAISSLDAFAGLATIAAERGYVRPELFAVDASEDARRLEIEGGRHPVVEAAQLDAPFVPNDTRLGADSSLVVLTGPNMSGKSTYLRQNALIVLMAQIGSFVSADAARIGLVDRIFTRVGSGDDISRGASTFMVEMVETANILRNASKQSLLVLDEVGRGTSTFDGLSIAWAVCEHVHDGIGARCLFATHYHQLTDLASKLERARNLNVAVREWGDEIVFLHRIEEGGTDRSYGIHVARLAGVPGRVLDRAKDVLSRIERDEEGLSKRILAEHAMVVAEGPRKASEANQQQASATSSDPDAMFPALGANSTAQAAEPTERSAANTPQSPEQLSLFDLLEQSGDPDLVSELRELQLDRLAPIEAWRWLERIHTALHAERD